MFFKNQTFLHEYFISFVHECWRLYWRFQNRDTLLSMESAFFSIIRKYFWQYKELINEILFPRRESLCNVLSSIKIFLKRRLALFQLIQTLYWDLVSILNVELSVAALWWVPRLSMRRPSKLHGPTVKQDTVRQAKGFIIDSCGFLVRTVTFYYWNSID